MTDHLLGQSLCSIIDRDTFRPKTINHCCLRTIERRLDTKNTKQHFDELYYGPYLLKLTNNTTMDHLLGNSLCSVFDRDKFRPKTIRFMYLV